MTFKTSHELIYSVLELALVFFFLFGEQSDEHMRHRPREL